jgi:hypothetical protein
MELPFISMAYNWPVVLLRHKISLRPSLLRSVLAGMAGDVVPDWVAVKALLAIVAVLNRSEPVAFCVHDTVADAEPLPLVGDTVNQDPLPDALQLPP